MKNEPTGKIFRSEVAEFLVVQMDAALERLVWLGLEHTKKGWLSKEQLQKILEGRGAIIIRGILNSLNPGAVMNARGLDEKMLWRVYWELRSNSIDMNIFEFIGELDDPYLTFV